jgi:hypothetical protein
MLPERSTRNCTYRSQNPVPAQRRLIRTAVGTGHFQRQHDLLILGELLFVRVLSSIPVV